MGIEVSRVSSHHKSKMDVCRILGNVVAPVCKVMGRGVPGTSTIIAGLVCAFIWLVSCFPSFILTGPTSFGRLEDTGEFAVSVYQGALMVQEHSFLGIGRPSFSVHLCGSLDAWRWYHQKQRNPQGALRWYFGQDRRYGELAMWYHCELRVLRVPMWVFMPVVFVLVRIAAVVSGLTLSRVGRVIDPTSRAYSP
jgi:hypothetical protein